MAAQAGYATTITQFVPEAEAAAPRVSWTELDRAAAAPDQLYATARHVAGGVTLETHYLFASGFPIVLPAGYPAQGIYFDLTRTYSGGIVTDASIRLVVNSQFVGQEKASTAVWSGTVTYGGSADTWGLTPVASDVNAAGFGVAIAAKLFFPGSMTDLNAVAALLDAVRCTVVYSAEDLYAPLDGVGTLTAALSVDPDRWEPQGVGALYAKMVASPLEPTYRLYADWDHDGKMGEWYEEIPAADLDEVSITRGRSDVLGRVAVGAADIVLDNVSGRYSPQNSASLLASHLHLWAVAADLTQYARIASLSNYTIQSGDNLWYSIYWPSSATAAYPNIAFAHRYTDGWWAWDLGLADQNGLSLHPNADISSYATEQWYLRRFTLPATHVGRVIGDYFFASAPYAPGRRDVGIRNILVTDPSCNIRKVVWGVGSLTPSISQTWLSADPLNLLTPVQVGVAPLRRVRLEATYDSKTYPLFTGHIIRLNPDLPLGGQRVQIYAEDPLRKLRNKRVSIPLLESVSLDTVASAVASAAGMTDVSIEVLPDTITYAYFDDVPALAALEMIVGAGMHTHYADAGGRYVLRSRYNNLGNYVARIFRVDSENVFQVRPEYAEETVTNYARVMVYAQEAGSQGELWRLPQTLLLAPGEAATVVGEYRDPDLTSKTIEILGKNIVTPVAITDYLGNLLEDDSGEDRTSPLTVTVSAQAQRATVKVTNTHSADAVWVTLLRLRGTPLRTESPATAEAQDATSQDLYERRDVTIDNRLMGTYAKALGFAQYLVLTGKEPLPRASLALRNPFPEAFVLDVDSLIGIEEPAHSGLGGTWIIESIAHKVIAAGGLQHDVEYGLRQWKSYDWFTLDRSTLDSSHALAY